LDCGVLVGAAVNIECVVAGVGDIIEDQPLSAMLEDAKMTETLTKRVLTTSFSKDAIHCTFVLTGCHCGCGNWVLAVCITLATDRPGATVHILPPVAPDLLGVVQLAGWAEHVVALPVETVPVLATVVVILEPAIAKLVAVDRMVTHLCCWVLRRTVARV